MYLTAWLTVRGILPGLDDPSTIMGALEALCNFNFSGVVLKDMTEFALKKVVNLLRTDSNPSIRMLAARVCAQLASHYTKHTDGTGIEFASVLGWVYDIMDL